MTLRSIARRALRRVGLEKIHHPSFVDLLLHEGVQTVLDVGANEGHYGAELREKGFTGTIHSFEPITDVYNCLARRSASDPRWHAHRLGVGDTNGRLSISVSAASVFSSFKPQSDYTSGKFVGAAEERREEVEVVRLDSFDGWDADQLSKTFLKVDTQGFEREVLAGAGDLLTRFHGIQLELPLRPLYVGQMLWIEMIEWMSQRGFEVAMAKENGFDWQEMRLLELDVLFWRKNP